MKSFQEILKHLPKVTNISIHNKSFIMDLHGFGKFIDGQKKFDDSGYSSAFSIILVQPVDSLGLLEARVRPIGHQNPSTLEAGCQALERLIPEIFSSVGLYLNKSFFTPHFSSTMMLDEFTIGFRFREPKVSESFTNCDLNLYLGLRRSGVYS